MEYTHLGRTGMKVSRVCLGTMNFGPAIEEKEAFYIMDAALDHGINFFDTADMYGIMPHIKLPGITEEIIGRWFKQGGNRRERVIIGTKVYNRMYKEVDGPNDDPGLSAYKVRRRLEDSLRRMQTDHIELYYMHEYDPHCSFEELWEVFGSIIYQGKVDYIGSSNFRFENIQACQECAEKMHHLGLVVEQHKLNLITRQDEETVIAPAAKMGLGVLTYSPMQGGLLSGDVLGERWQNSKRTQKYIGRMSEARMKQLSEYSKLCKELGESEVTVAHAWLLNNPNITAPIVGPENREQLASTLHALEVKLPEDFMKKLDEIFPACGTVNL